MRHGGATQIMRGDRNHILVRPDGYIAEFSAKEVLTYCGHDVDHVEAAR
jgi:hypothetical protein